MLGYGYWDSAIKSMYRVLLTANVYTVGLYCTAQGTVNRRVTFCSDQPSKSRVPVAVKLGTHNSHSLPPEWVLIAADQRVLSSPVHSHKTTLRPPGSFPPILVVSTTKVIT